MTNYQVRILTATAIQKIEEDTNKFLKTLDFKNIKEVKFHLDLGDGTYKSTIVYIG